MLIQLTSVHVLSPLDIWICDLEALWSHCNTQVWTSKASEVTGFKKPPLRCCTSLFIVQVTSEGQCDRRNHKTQYTNIKILQYSVNKFQKTVRHLYSAGNNLPKSTILSCWEQKFTVFSYTCLKVHIWLPIAPQPVMWCLYQLWNSPKLLITINYIQTTSSQELQSKALDILESKAGNQFAGR